MNGMDSSSPHPGVSFSMISSQTAVGDVQSGPDAHAQMTAGLDLIVPLSSVPA